MATLLGMGNPLLDISAVVPNEELAKWDAKPGDALLVMPETEAKYNPLYDSLTADYPVEYIAGGATQNSIRVAQWMTQSPGATAYIGCIGTDKAGEQLKASLALDGVTNHYLEDASTPTGKCAVLVNGGDRALIANIQAANNYKIDHLKENTAVLEAASIVYSAGFFLTVSVESMVMAADACKAAGKTYCLNLSAPFLMQVPPLFDGMKQVLPKADVIFCNETEAATFAEVSGWDTKDCKEIAKRLQALDKETAEKPRMVVITQGADPTVVATATEVTEYPVIKCDNIVDTNGAGDSFVGGFLSGMMKKQPISECVRAGNYAANVVIQRSGCSYPAKPDFA